MRSATPERTRAGLYIHAAAFAVGIVLMLVINLAIGRPYWIVWVLLGWGVGLMSHWLSVRSRLPHNLKKASAA